MARPTPALDPSRNCWRIERATSATVIIDADDYFGRARQGMLGAEHQLLLVGWDFDARIKLVHDGEDDAPAQIGAFIDWLIGRRRGLDIYLLRWDTGAIKSLFRGRTILTLARWLGGRRVHLKLDGHHPMGASHHQKIVVIDDCLAFCGGIDMTDRRWDTRDHDDDAPLRVGADGKPYGPWHDATTALSGPVATALGELCRTRWQDAGGDPIAAPPLTEICWPDDLDVGFRDCDVAISRTMPAMPGREPVYEIEALYLDLIARAERWIYAESQYFASHKIAKAIAARLDEPDGPEIVIVNPVKAEGWLEPIAMDSARARLFEALQTRDRYNRLRIYHPVTRGGAPIYVHAKVTIVDGEILRVGSSNFNNRSMRLDSECDITIDSTLPANAHSAEEIRAVAFNLLSEHLDSNAATVEERFDATGSLIATIDALSIEGQRRLVRYQVPEMNAVEEALADHQVLDPENPEELIETMTGNTLMRGIADIDRRWPTARIAAAGVVVAGAITAAVVRARQRRDI
ncbi:phospholipase D-like domain-containing protein [Sphingomonas oligophenolica]|uniref:Phospholipase D n=1 Tax=Sphingomonas oligophenolica TaxID=301154 RepID=A0A502CNF7_9SPHN|nr:phospholipase D-like domain-containing protein [Sphingomonas oligophenolica]TPG14292.1 phospholipase [Sphingomonas oligophenolica]